MPVLAVDVLFDAAVRNQLLDHSDIMVFGDNTIRMNCQTT